MPIIIKFSAAIVAIFVFSYIQALLQTYASEKVAGTCAVSFQKRYPDKAMHLLMKLVRGNY